MTTSFFFPSPAGMPSPSIDSALATSVEVEPAQVLRLSELISAQGAP